MQTLAVTSSPQAQLVRPEGFVTGFVSKMPKVILITMTSYLEPEAVIRFGRSHESLGWLFFCQKATNQTQSTPLSGKNQKELSKTQDIAKDLLRAPKVVDYWFSLDSYFKHLANEMPHVQVLDFSQFKFEDPSQKQLTWTQESPNYAQKRLMLEPLTKLTNLQLLNFSSCEIGAVCFTLLKRCSSLTSLNLSRCEMDLDAHLHDLSSLSGLKLTDCKNLRDHSLFRLKNFPNLRSLSISRCEARITSIGWKCLGTFPALEHLNLERSKITNCDLKHLTPLNKLKVLNLTDCENLSHSAIQYLINNLNNLNYLFILSNSKPNITSDKKCNIIWKLDLKNAFRRKLYYR